jgi:ABC-type anion transport system duplicated permease subunit
LQVDVDAHRKGFDTPPELQAGCTRRQKMWRVLVPAAKPSLMLGVNQTVNSTMNMVQPSAVWRRIRSMHC